MNLAQNEFKDIPRSYSSYRNLKQLNMTHNKMLKLYLDSKLPYLEILDVSHNFINQIEFNLIKMEYLFYLDLSNNPLRRLPKLNDYFKSLKYLFLNNCSLTHIGNITYLNSLTELHLSNNPITKFNYNFYSDKLRVLDISYCNLNNVNTSSLSSVQMLNLSHNAIESISENFLNSLDSARIIDLSHNKISSLPEDLILLGRHLEQLFLGNNPIKEFTYINSPSIVLIDLSYCHISQIYQVSLEGMPSLTELNLNNNRLTSIPDNIKSDSLYRLDISSCRIKSINNKTFKYLINLHELNLEDNLLTTIDSNHLPSRLTKLDIDDNPFTCECNKLKKMYEWLSTIDTYMYATCEFPDTNTKLSWYEACRNEWYASEYNNDHLWMYSLGIIAAMFTLLSVYLLIRKVRKYHRDRDEQEREESRRAEEREALRRMERLQREAIDDTDHNAPDPRELQRPPSYHEAVLLPPLDASHPSLAGSLNSLASRRSLHASNPDISKKSKARRKRRRRKSDSSETNRCSRIVIDSDTSEQEINTRREALESDF